MGIFDVKKFKCDKKFLICCGITIFCAILLGIVLYKTTNINVYFKNFTSEYVYRVFHFKSGSLFFSHCVGEIFYLYLFFVIAYFCKIKIAVLPVLFIRCLFSVIYCIILCAFFSLGGIFILITVYLPSVVLSLVCGYFISEGLGCVKKNYVFFAPLALAVINSVVLLVLVNVLFRIAVMIV